MSDPHQRVTLQTIADHAGVTRALVSMALRNSSKVAQLTRIKIQGLAKELGYTPNPMVRALMTSVRQGRGPTYRATLAFVTQYKTRDIWKTWHSYPEYIRGATARGQELGYNIEHFWMGDYAKDPARFTAVLKARGIAGIIVPPLPIEKRSLEIDISGFSIVALGYTLDAPTVPRVCNHHVQTMEQAIQRALEHGYERIGIVIRDTDIERVNHLWMAGVTTAQRRFPRAEIVIFTPAAWSQAAYEKWYRRTRPEVIIGVTLDVWKWTQALGRRIPDQLGFLHLDCQRNDPLSGMHQNTHRLGGAAVEILASLVEGNIRCEEEESRITMIGSDFNPGTTIRQIPRVRK